MASIELDAKQTWARIAVSFVGFGRFRLETIVSILSVFPWI